MPDKKGKSLSAQVLIWENSLVVSRKMLLRPIGTWEAKTEAFEGITFCRRRVTVHGGWIDKPKRMLLCEHDLVIALSLSAVFFQGVQALLKGVADLRLLEVGPLVDGFINMAIARGSHESIIEEVAAFLVGEDIGLVVDVKDLQEEVGGSAGNTDEKETRGDILCGACSSNSHCDKNNV